jgi:hypothetical protein
MAPPSQSLEGEAAEVIAGVRSAFAGVIGALPTPINKAADVSRVLALSRKLGWQVWRVVDSPDPFTAAQHLPSPAGIDSFLRAAMAAGVGAELVGSARSAADKVESLVVTHAGDRRSLGMMIDSLAGEKREQAEEQHRKLAFQANSFVWGSQVRTRLVLHVLTAGSEPGRADGAIVNGLFGLRRNRPEAKRHLFSTGVRDALATVHSPAREALWPGATGGAVPSGLPLVPEFCSHPLPAIRQSEPRDGFVDFELAEWPMGETGSVSIVTGEVFRNFATRYRRPGDTTANLTAHINRATELLVHNMIIREDVFRAVRPEALVYGELDRVERAEAARREDDRLPIRLSVGSPGAAATAAGFGAWAATPEVPRYSELLEWVFGRLGWDPREFVVHRLRMAYPVLPSAVVLRFDLPEGS